jgi:hypothetical protein
MYRKTKTHLQNAKLVLLRTWSSTPLMGINVTTMPEADKLATRGW